MSKPGDAIDSYSNRGLLTQTGMIDPWTEVESHSLKSNKTTVISKLKIVPQRDITSHFDRLETINKCRRPKNSWIQQSTINWTCRWCATRITMRNVASSTVDKMLRFEQTKCWLRWVAARKSTCRVQSLVTIQWNQCDRDMYKAGGLAFWRITKFGAKITTICTSMPGDVIKIYSNRGLLTQTVMNQYIAE